MSTPAGEIVAAGRVAPLVLVQVLRALSALLVLAGHTQGAVIAYARSRGVELTPLAFPGGFGVDMFFCISGFIMVVSSNRLFESPGARASFLARRAVRLVPMYWFATICMLAMLVFGRHGYEGSLGTALATSLFFWPFPTYGVQGSAVFPLHTLGWSLNYEVFFYLLLAVFIVLPMQRAVSALCFAIIAIVSLGLVLHPDDTALRFWSQPIIAEFAFGVLIGGAWLQGLRLSGWVASFAAVTGLVYLWTNPLGLAVMPGTTTTPNDLMRLSAWGLPAVLILIAAVGYEQGREVKSPALRPLKALGDASYSLYLMHPFALILVGKAWALGGLDRHFGWPVLAAALLIAAITVGRLSYRFIEQPAARWLHKPAPLRPRVAL